MQLVGTGKRLTKGGIEDAAKLIGCEPAVIRAVLDVEARGNGFDDMERPVALFEAHKFYKNLGPGKKRDLAVKQDLARPKWVKKYPKDSDGVYKQIYAAMQIDEEAALKSVSWGLSQILGENYAEAGCSDVFEFVERNLQGEDEQLELMVKVVRYRHLDDELREYRWAPFARSWNGPGYRDNDYDGKLERAYRKSKGKASPVVQTDYVSMGDTGQRVVDLQKNLIRLGFFVKPDGDFGPETKRQLRLFQLDQGLEGTGRADDKTLNLLVSLPDKKVPEARQDVTNKELAEQGDPIAKTGQILVTGAKVAVGVGTAGGVVQQSGVGDQLMDAADKVQEIKPAVDATVGIFQVFTDNLWLLIPVAGVAVIGAVWYILKLHRDNVRAGRTL